MAIEVGDTVKKINRDGKVGKVLTVGELIEVEWLPDLITLEYNNCSYMVRDTNYYERKCLKTLFF